MAVSYPKRNMIEARNMLKSLTALAQMTIESSILAQASEDPSLFETFRQWLRNRLGPPLKSIQAPIDEWLGTSPMWGALACALGLYAAALIWVWFLRHRFVFRGAPDEHWWRDLRIWATVVTVPYVVIYLILGR